MKQYIIFAIIISAFLVSGCAPKTSTTNANDITNKNTNADIASDLMNDSANKSDDEAMDDSKMDDHSEPMTDVSYQDYENKAIGYMIKIPNKWYWRHYHKAEIGDTNPNVDDYLFISKTHSIESFATELPAEITIEVSDRALSDFNDGVSGLSRSVTNVGGVDAVRYQGVINDLMLEKMKKIEYQFTHNDRTFRIIYMNATGDSDLESVFTSIVESFHLVN